MDDEREELIKTLQDAADIFDDDRELVRDVDTRMAGAQLAFLAVVRYFRTIGVEERLFEPLLHPFAVLSDVGEGSKKPILEALNWADAAAAVDFLVEAGATLDAALQKVSRDTGNQVTPATLKDFRKNVRAGRARQEAIDRYWFIKKFPAAMVLKRVPELFRPSKV